MAFQIKYRQGGMLEFEKTGIYPRKLYVYDPNLNKRWSRKISEDKNSGELKIGNKIIYQYFVDIDLNEVRIFDDNGTSLEDCLITFEMWD